MALMCDMRLDYLVTVMIKLICCHVFQQASKKTDLLSLPRGERMYDSYLLAIVLNTEKLVLKYYTVGLDFFFFFFFSVAKLFFPF